MTPDHTICRHTMKESLMEIVILPDNQAIGSLGADAIGALLQRKPDAVLGLATGSSPLAIYDELAGRCAAGKVSFAKARGFTLDEYVGTARRPSGELPQRHRQGLRLPGRFRTRRRPVDRTGWPRTFPAACAAYEAAMAEAGGVDLQILGIGTDGHIGFNEPGSSLASRTRIKTLTRQTRIDNARFFDGEPGRGAHPLPDPGPGHDHVRPSHRAGRNRVRARPRPSITWSKGR